MAAPAPVLGEERVSTSQQLPPPAWGRVLHPNSGTVTRSSHGKNIQHQGGAGMGFVQMVGFLLVLHLWPVMKRGWEKSKEKPEAKVLGRTVMLLFASPCGFPPSLSKDAREAAAAAPQHFHPTRSHFPKGSGLEQSGELSILHPLLPALCLGCFLVSVVREDTAVSWDGCTGSGQMCFCGRKGVCVWEGLLLIMCTLGRAWAGGWSTGLDLRAPGATATSWSRYPSLSQVPQILETQVAQLPTSLGPCGSQ